MWTDKWIPTSYSGMITSRKPSLCKLVKVSELIWPETRTWNIGRINRVFSRYNAAKIFQIPLTSFQVCDTLMWKDNRNGQYSVKSGYEQLRCLQNTQQMIGPSNSNGSKLWQKIWAIGASPRCNELVWRACKEVLPVRTNLIRRSLNIDPICPCCGEEEETTIHALLKCEAVRRMWFASHLSIHIQMMPHEIFSTG